MEIGGGWGEEKREGKGNNNAVRAIFASLVSTKCPVA